MEPMRYYHILEINKNENVIEIFGKNINNRYFYVSYEKNGKDVIIGNDSYKVEFYETKVKKDIYSRLKMRRKRESEWKNVSDLDLLYLYNRFMDLKVYLHLHEMIMLRL